jgi:hypothetical protein
VICGVAYPFTIIDLRCNALISSGTIATSLNDHPIFYVAAGKGLQNRICRQILPENKKSFGLEFETQRI